MDLPAVQRTIEHACQEFNVPATRQRAEATLLEFRNSVGALPACQHILDNSHDPLARFQAATALRECAVREWGLIGAPERLAVRGYCIGYAMQRAAGEESFVRAQMLQAASSLLKRGWMDDSEAMREAFFAEVHAASGPGAAPDVRRVAMELMRMVVLEFSPQTASALGLSWEHHERCRVSFEAVYLQKLYVHGLGIAREATASGAAAQGADAGLCAACIKLMVTILGWDFARGGASSGGGFGFVPESTRAARETGVLVQPGAAWRDVLLAEENVDWLLQLLPVLKGRDGPLPQAARELVVSLACLSGDVLPKEDEGSRQSLGLGGATQGGGGGGALAAAHLQRILHAAMAWLSPPEAALAAAAHGAGEGEFLDGCRAMASLGAIHRAPSLDVAMPVGYHGGAGAMGLLAQVTCGVVQAGGVEEGADDGWAGAALQDLLDFWSVAVQLPPVRHRPGVPAGPPPTLPAAAVDGAGSVMQAYVAASLGVAARGAHEEDDGQDQDGTAGAQARDGRLGVIAHIARAAPHAVLPMLGQLINERHARLQQVAAAGADPSEPLEELCWLLHTSAHVLADPVEGETPLVPDPLAAASASASAVGSPCPVQGLGECLLHIACLVLDAAARPVISPRLMESAVVAVAQWAPTYLFPEKPHSAAASGGGALEAAFGPAGGGVQIIDTLVRVAQTCLVVWRGEADLQAVVCTRLLPALAKKPPVCERLVQLETWQALCAAFARRDPGLSVLPARVYRTLSESLCRGAVGLAASPAAAGYVSQLLQPLGSEISALAQRPDLSKIADRPDVIHQLGCLLEGLRGGVRATLAKSQPAIFAVFSGCMEAFLALLRQYRGNSLVVCMLLKLTADLVEGHVAFLSPPDAQRLCQFVLELLKLYSDFNLGKVSVEAARSLRAERDKEKYKDLRALLKLLTCLTAKDMIDFGALVPGQPPAHLGGGDAAPGQAVDVAQVVLLGLHILIPLISEEMLKFPKLCRQYFRLLSFLLEVYPEKVAGLPADAFSQLMRTLEYGLTQPDSQVAENALEALTGIARFHCKEGQAGRPGLGANAQVAMASGVGALAHLMQVVLRRLLFEECARSVVEQAADALLPLMVCEPGTYEHVGVSLLSGQQDEAMHARLGGALRDLMGTNGITHQLDRQNRIRFRKNVHRFVADVRGVVRKQ